MMEKYRLTSEVNGRKMHKMIKKKKIKKIVKKF